MNLSFKYSDQMGIIANTLCMLHCFATPFLFLTQAQVSTVGHQVPLLWQAVNYIFILISFFAVYSSAKKTSNFSIKVLLVFFWLILSFLIVNEGLEGFHIAEFYTYLSASILSILHIYNLKYCNCKDEECCTQNQ